VLAVERALWRRSWERPSDVCRQEVKGWPRRGSYFRQEKGNRKTPEREGTVRNSLRGFFALSVTMSEA
jgi:hypothetical protein